MVIVLAIVMALARCGEMVMELARVFVLALALCCRGNCRLHCVGIGILYCQFL